MRACLRDYLGNLLILARGKSGAALVKVSAASVRRHGWLWTQPYPSLQALLSIYFPERRYHFRALNVADIAILEVRFFTNGIEKACIAELNVTGGGGGLGVTVGCCGLHTG